MTATFPDERARLAALDELAILDTPREQIYDDVVHLAATICDTPIAVINFIDADRQWGKALVGMDDSEAPRDVSFCARASDLVGRFAGDEFVVLCPDLAEESTVGEIARRLGDAVAQPATVGDGTAVARGSDVVEDLLRRADHSMYRAKRAERGSGSAGLSSVG